MPTIRESGQALPSGVVHCPGEAGPHHLAAAVGEPADSIENVIRTHGAVVNPRMDGRPRCSIPVVAHWPPPEPAATSGCWTEGLSRQESGRTEDHQIGRAHA